MKNLFLLNALAFLAVPLSSVTAQDVIAVNWTGDAFEIDSTTGAGSMIGPTGFTRLNSMARDGSGTLYSFSDSELINIDPTTGLGSFIGSSTIVSVRGLAWVGGTLYAAEDSGGGDLLYRVNPTTAAASLVGNIGFPGIQGLTNYQGALYGWDVGSGSGIGDGLIRIDTTTGAGTDVDPGTVGSGFEVQCLTQDGSGGLFGASNEMYRIDPATGATTLIGMGGYTDVRGMEFRDCDFTLSNPSPGIVGVTNTVNFNCATANAQVALVHSFQAGSTPVGGACPGLSVDMNNPLLLGIFNANAAGNGSASGFAPPGLSGQTSLLQAVDITGCQKSNLVTYNWP